MKRTHFCDFVNKSSRVVLFLIPRFFVEADKDKIKIVKIKMAAIPVNFVIILSFIFTLFYLLGLHNFLKKVEDNACEMTYMFEYPQYVVSSL